MVYNIMLFYRSKELHLLGVGVIMICLEAGMIAEALICVKRHRKEDKSLV
ncbi:MAG: hypothetical protein P9L90_04965 [Candidatus Aadella gelida]|nr:hypothetical protein [Candidatus Aadella gelida]